MKGLDLRGRAAKFTLTMIICAIIIAIILVSSLIALLIGYIAVQTGVMGLLWRDGIPPTAMLLFVTIAVVVLGTFITSTIGRVPLRPVKRLVTQMNRLASGDFSVRLDFGPPLGSHPAVKEISDSFNTMAKELGNTEMLRSDFINSFSHEFKTPIVSIAGFARLLRRPDLTDAEREEYIGIIEEESMRLSAMATNVLNLSKVENQSILTDTTTYNLSEQLRSALLLLERKWAKKGIVPELDIGEYSITANEQMMLGVWINLFDNAIKFSPEGGTVEASVRESDGSIFVSIANTGEPIRSEDIPKVFNKFYRGDSSHAHEGNGIGLSLVKRIVELHGGKVTLESTDEKTVFTVQLAGMKL